MDDIPPVMTRRGHPEETHFSFSYTPVRDDRGAVRAFFCACTEITDHVLDDEFPLSMFYEALGKKLGPTIAATSGITGASAQN